MAQQTTLPQTPRRGGDPQQQIWTVWTMLRYFINAVYDVQIAAALGGIGGGAAGTASVPIGNTSVVVVHAVGKTNGVAIVPVNGAPKTVWGSDAYWVSAKTINSFQINMAVAPVGSAQLFDWVVRAV